MKSVRQQRRSKAAKKASDASKRRLEEWVGALLLSKMGRGPGPYAWCNTCGRRHRRGRACNLYLRTRTAKSGRKMKVWAH